MNLENTTISSRLISLLEGHGNVPVSEVRMGLGYTAVMLASGEMGLAYTFRDEIDGCCSVFKGPRPLAGRRAGDLLVLLGSANSIEAGVGLACANALIARQRANASPEPPASPGIQSGDVLEQILLRAEDQVAMVGHFEPLVEGLKQRARCLTVFERLEEPVGDLRPVKEAPGVLLSCQVALITSTSIINHTVDDLLRAASGCREVVLLGPSTPFLPEVFRGTPVTLLSGARVLQPAQVLQMVSEGGGMSEFKPYVRKENLRLARHPLRAESAS